MLRKKRPTGLILKPLGFTIAVGSILAISLFLIIHMKESTAAKFAGSWVWVSEGPVNWSLVLVEEGDTLKGNYSFDARNELAVSNLDCFRDYSYDAVKNPYAVTGTVSNGVATVSIRSYFGSQVTAGTLHVVGSTLKWTANTDDPNRCIPSHAILKVSHSNKS